MTLKTETEDLLSQLANAPTGMTTTLRQLGTGVQEPLWNRLGELETPVLAVAGQQDSRYARLAEGMARAIGTSARAATVAGAGHAAHLERPAEFRRLLVEFLTLHPTVR